MRAVSRWRSAAAARRPVYPVSDARAAGVGGEAVDGGRHGRSAPSPAGGVPPAVLEAAHRGLVVADRGARSAGGCGERFQPGGERFGAGRAVGRADVGLVCVERGEVGAAVAGQGEAYRRHCRRAGADQPVFERGVEHGPAGASVAVAEGVDRLELGVGDGGLQQRRVVVGAEIGDEVV